MRRIVVVISLMLAILVGLTSCGPDRSAELKQVDSLRVELNGLFEKLNELDSLEVLNAYTDYQAKTKEVKKYFEDDKKDSVWVTVTEYGLIKKPLRNFLRDMPGLKEELYYSQFQMDTLYTDVKKNRIPKEAFQQYLQTEAIAVEVLKGMITPLVDQAADEMIRYDSLTPHIEKIIVFLKEAE